LIGAPAELLVARKLLQNKTYKRSRYHFLLLNLNIADSVVVFIMIPVEIGWMYTNDWRAGNMACKVLQFFRAFGPYSSSLLLICLSIDRYYAVVKPFSYAFLDRKINFLLTFVWITSFVISLPQVMLFHVILIT
jgi:gonadotropin-releasing hormone receptor